MKEEDVMMWWDTKLSEVKRHQAILREALRKHDIEYLEGSIIPMLGRDLISDFMQNIENEPYMRATELIRTFCILRDKLKELDYSPTNADLMAMILMRVASPLNFYQLEMREGVD